MKQYETITKDVLQRLVSNVKSKLASVAFTGKYIDLTGRPTTMKNPKKLTFTGGAIGTYDGSAEMSVEIPTSLPANGGTAETISETLPISKGGTGATNAADALVNMGKGTRSETEPFILNDNDSFVWKSTSVTGDEKDYIYATPFLKLWNYIYNKISNTLDNFIQKAGGTMTGWLNINGNNATTGLKIRRNSIDNESASFLVEDSGLLVQSRQDEANSQIQFMLIFDDTEKNQGAGAGTKVVKLIGDAKNATIDYVTVIKMAPNDFAALYSLNDDVWLRFKKNSGSSGHLSAKYVFETLGETYGSPITITNPNDAGTIPTNVISFYFVKNGWCLFHIFFDFSSGVSNWFPFSLPGPNGSISAPYLYYNDTSPEQNGELRIERTTGACRISANHAKVKYHACFTGCYPV